ncbi:exodeoxyribonuclease V subunit beta [Desulfomicrobium baculatum]|uniref:DNA 3'-5' helicase n=1 Tax=Desulfomicrobium baculatum (strain DSM 4028 / VKM B-1378 / X) TaxID=525897 RepID=C7LVF7_DESBD|nr:exodeoxyribonuclease V subunit beta [Desulfomicrobium baculatum]ACU88499.1 exodeoxyribonuclease V, beta subunit [Desulfomicrobium baculatum DSM 4028]
MEPMDLCTAPLDGTTLIEASAGTGKTYTLTGLFVRLLLEKNLTVDQILVVTFTDAATEELRGRIRKRLSDVAGVLAGELEADEELEWDLLARFGGTDAARRLELALRNFDLAQIFTIHGFCQRMLGRNGFECSALFDTQLEPDLSDLRRQVCVDFWRSHILPLGGLTGTEVRKQLTPDHLTEMSGLPFLGQRIRIVPGTLAPDPAPLDRAVREACERLKASWSVMEPEVRTLLLARADNFNARQFSPQKLDQRLKATRDFLNDPRLDAKEQLKALGELTSTYVQGMTKKAFTAPEHRLFDEIQNILDQVEALRHLLGPFVVHLRHAFLSGVTARLDELKRRRNVLGFDDLLRNMHAALASPELVAAARTQYRAALIDEFQDTDGLQYDIFRTLFATGDGENSLFLIGDPKQAIYSFRGADLHTYLTAADSCERGMTLGVNYRSTPELIAAVNRLFFRPDNPRPFLDPKIAYQPVSAPDKERDRFREDGQTPAPMVLWQVKSADKPLAKGALAPRICRAVAAEISRLLRGAAEGRIRIGDAPLLPGDIAVLVETHAQGEAIHQALGALRIPSVVTHTSSVFASPEASELLSVLRGMAECQRPAALRTALAAPMIGLTAPDLALIDEDGEKLEEWFERFLACRELWDRRGVMAAVRRLFAGQDVRKRLVSLPDGERRMTNVLHCLELLHSRERESGAAMHALLTWFARRLGTEGTEESQLRLDTDRDAVQIVTIHKSKGLQYPVVFCPFIFGRARCPEDRALVHEDGLLLDLGTEELPRRIGQALSEAQAERVRLLYVALTRAKCRCYAIWGRINEAETSGAAWLFHGHRADENSTLSWETVDEDMVCADLRVLANDDIEVAELPDAEPKQGPPQFTHAPDLRCRNWDRVLGSGFGLASFTGLTRGMEHGARPGLDEVDASGQAADEWSMANFPCGAAAGSCLHRIFERIDFADEITIPAAVTEALAAYGFDPAWHQTVHDMVKRVLHADLGEGLQLGGIEQKDKLVEMEFLFPLRPVTRETLAAVYRDSAGLLPPDLPERMGNLRFEPRRGFMTGFMDLVVRSGRKFYLLDWKSNWLGPTPGHYTPDALHAAMAGSHYFLQYHLYCLALKRHLALRKPGFDYEKEFGGVRYVFLRGIDPQTPGQGVHANRPDPRFLDALDKALIDTEKR